MSRQAHPPAPEPGTGLGASTDGTIETVCRTCGEAIIMLSPDGEWIHVGDFCNEMA